jgi:hypothetical protein
MSRHREPSLLVKFCQASRLSTISPSWMCSLKKRVFVNGKLSSIKMGSRSMGRQCRFRRATFPRRANSPSSLMLVIHRPQSHRMSFQLFHHFILRRCDRFVAEAIYGSIPGALFLDDVQRWQVPCDAVVNVSWTFGGVDIPMHPLDMTRVMPSDETKQTCQGSWRPKEPEPNNNDASFGMGFCMSLMSLIAHSLTHEQCATLIC